MILKLAGYIFSSAAILKGLNAKNGGLLVW